MTRLSDSARGAVDDRGGGRVEVILERRRVAVWLVGEHDPATVGLIGAAFVEAAACELDVVVDLSAATFMDASTLGALMRGQALLVGCERRMTLRSPRRRAREILEICELTDLVEPAEPLMASRPTGALQTWVEVPVSDDTVQERSPRVRGSEPTEATTPGAASATTPQNVNVPERRGGRE